MTMTCSYWVQEDTNESFDSDFLSSFSFITSISTFSTNYLATTAVPIITITDFALLRLHSFWDKSHLWNAVQGHISSSCTWLLGKVFAYYSRTQMCNLNDLIRHEEEQQLSHTYNYLGSKSHIGFLKTSALTEVTARALLLKHLHITFAINSKIYINRLY